MRIELTPDHTAIFASLAELEFKAFSFPWFRGILHAN